MKITSNKEPFIYKNSDNLPKNIYNIIKSSGNLLNKIMLDLEN